MRSTLEVNCLLSVQLLLAIGWVIILELFFCSQLLSYTFTASDFQYLKYFSEAHIFGFCNADKCPFNIFNSIVSVFLIFDCKQHFFNSFFIYSELIGYLLFQLWYRVNSQARLICVCNLKALTSLFLEISVITEIRSF